VQAIFPRKQIRVVAPDPTRRIVLISIIGVGVVVIPLLVLHLLSGPLHNLFEWQPSPLLPSWQIISLLLSLVIPMLVDLCFFPFAQYCLSRNWRWEELERNRQQVAKEFLQGFLPVQFPLPVIVGPLPPILSIRTRRNWRATCNVVVLFTLLWGFWLVSYAYNWQPNLQSFAQQGQIGWMLLKISINSTLYSIPILFTFLAIILAPHQHILADQDGLYCYLGPRATYIPWHEARLFSVIAEEMGILVYELASESSLIRWSYTLIKDNFPYATFGSSPLKIVQGDPSEDEYRRSIRLLTVLVAEKTGLPLIDLRQLSDEQLLTGAANHMP